MYIGCIEFKASQNIRIFSQYKKEETISNGIHFGEEHTKLREKPPKNVLFMTTKRVWVHVFQLVVGHPFLVSSLCISFSFVCVFFARSIWYSCGKCLFAKKRQRKSDEIISKSVLCGGNLFACMHVSLKCNRMQTGQKNEFGSAFFACIHEKTAAKTKSSWRPAKTSKLLFFRAFFCVESHIFFTQAVLVWWHELIFVPKLFIVSNRYGWCFRMRLQTEIQRQHSHWNAFSFCLFHLFEDVLKHNNNISYYIFEHTPNEWPPIRQRINFYYLAHLRSIFKFKFMTSTEWS